MSGTEPGPERPDLSYRSAPPPADLADLAIRRGRVIRRRRRAAAGVGGLAAVVIGASVALNLLPGGETSTALPAGSATAPGPTRSLTNPDPTSPGPTPTPTTPDRSPSVSPGVQACTDATIRVTAGQLDAAMGTAGVQILFTNTGPTECLLQGYPGVALAGADHQQVGTDAARRPATIPLLALAPGGQGAAQFLVANGTGYEPPTATPCSQAPVAGLRVYAPGSRKLVFVPAPLQVCTGVRPTIGPVEAPGSTS